MTDDVRITHGVWRRPEVAHDADRRVDALLTAAPVGAVISGLSAARLHGLWLPLPHPDEPLELVLRGHVDDQRGHAGSRRDELRGRRRRLRTDEMTEIDGVRVTTLARTWVDLAEVLPPPDLLAAGDCALRCGVTPHELVEAARRARGRRGIVRARAILPLLNVRSRSRPESHLRYAVIAVGLPAPRVNRPIYSDLGEWLAEPDLSYLDAKLAIEYNGADHAGMKRMRNDITREVDVESRGGWRVITVGPAEVFNRPDQTAIHIANVRRERLRRGVALRRTG